MKSFLKSFFLIIPFLVGLLIMNSCHKEKFSTKGDLSFSNDTLTFDTIFTTLGSTTKFFMIRNTQSKSLNISDIKLMQLAGTQFRINIDGVSGTEFKNVDIPAHDSLYVFVEVTINPSAANAPFIVLDKVQFITNGNTQNVVLEAMGQNAYYHFSDSITTNVTWHADKPHIIVNKNGGLPILGITHTGTLNLDPKCQIFMAPNAVITVDGTLNAHGGNWADSIKFQYIRTDYAGLPGQWLGITYGRASGAASINMDHVIIDQSTFGLSDEYVLNLLAQSQITTSVLTNYSSSSNLPSVTLNNVIIRNTSGTAMSSICSNLTATNSLFHSASGQLVLLGMGGKYTFTNCTLANAYSQYVSPQSPVLTIVDCLLYLNKGPQVGPFATTVTINNSIIAGNASQNGNQLAFSLLQPSSDRISFNNCFLTSPRDTVSAYATNTNNIDTTGDPQYLQPPLFTLPFNDNYMPDSASIVLNRDSAALQPAADLFDYSRTGTKTIGAIVWHH